MILVIVRRTFRCLAVSALVSVVSLAARAQAVAGESEVASKAHASHSIEEVVVTARRREEDMQAVPIPITALLGKDLKARGIQDLTGLSRVTPNLDFTKSGTNGGAAEVFLRGIGQSNWSPTQDPKVGIYLDGVYLGRPIGAVFDLVDVSRVEVLRGPQGTVFGRNTTAGLVHIITNKPTDRFESWIQGGAGNAGQLSLAAMLNTPVAANLNARFTVQSRRADGYVKDRSTGVYWNNVNNQIARGALSWTPTASLSMEFTADYERVRQHPNLGQCEWKGPKNGADTLTTGGLPFIAYIFNVYDQIAADCNSTTPFASDENDPGGRTSQFAGELFTMDIKTIRMAARLGTDNFSIARPPVEGLVGGWLIGCGVTLRACYA